MTHPQAITETQLLPDVELTQKRGGKQTRFKFGEDELAYTVIDKTGSSSFQIKYTQLTKTRDFFIERNTWLQNVGLLWIAIGVVFTALNVIAEKPPLSIWLPIGVGCWLWAHFRTTRYTKIPAENGTLYVIEDAQKERILHELETRRLNQLRRWYDFLSPDEDPARQRSRYQWLHKEGVLTDADLKQRLTTLDLQFAVEPEAPASVELIANEDAGQRRLLN